MNHLPPETVQRLMRRNGKTIRGLARQMNITMSRVRRVRERGVQGAAFCQDWLAPLTTCDQGGSQQATNIAS